MKRKWRLVIAAGTSDAGNPAGFEAALICEKETLPIMDLTNLSLPDLRALQENIKQELKKREDLEITKAREQILAIAQSVGMPLKGFCRVSNLRSRSA